MSRSRYFFFNDTATTEIYTLSLHDALPSFAHAWDRYTGAEKGRLASEREIRTLRAMLEASLLEPFDIDAISRPKHHSGKRPYIRAPRRRRRRAARAHMVSPGPTKRTLAAVPRGES